MGEAKRRFWASYSDYAPTTEQERDRRAALLAVRQLQPQKRLLWDSARHKTVRNVSVPRRAVARTPVDAT